MVEEKKGPDELEKIQKQLSKDVDRVTFLGKILNWSPVISCLGVISLASIILNCFFWKNATVELTIFILTLIIFFVVLAMLVALMSWNILFYSVKTRWWLLQFVLVTLEMLNEQKKKEVKPSGQ